MRDLHLPFKIRWAGEPMPNLSGFAEPLAIPFWLRPAAIPVPSQFADKNAKPRGSGQ